MGVGTNFGTIAQFSAEPSDRGKNADKKVVEQFVKFVKDEDPDIIVTYNGDAFDWPYLQERAEESGLRVDVGRDGSTPISHKGAIPRISVTGRANVDLYRIVERDLGEIKVKTLKLVSEALGIMRTDERVMIAHEQLSGYWNRTRSANCFYSTTRTTSCPK
jgi:DNA polymerase I